MLNLAIQKMQVFRLKKMLSTARKRMIPDINAAWATICPLSREILDAAKEYPNNSTSADNNRNTSIAYLDDLLSALSTPNTERYRDAISLSHQCLESNARKGIDQIFTSISKLPKKDGEKYRLDRLYNCKNVYETIIVNFIFLRRAAIEIATTEYHNQDVSHVSAYIEHLNVLLDEIEVSLKRLKDLTRQSDPVVSAKVYRAFYMAFHKASKSAKRAKAECEYSCVDVGIFTLIFLAPYFALMWFPLAIAAGYKLPIYGPWLSFPILLLFGLVTTISIVYSRFLGLTQCESSSMFMSFDTVWPLITYITVIVLTVFFVRHGILFGISCMPPVVGGILVAVVSLVGLVMHGLELKNLLFCPNTKKCRVKPIVLGLTVLGFVAILMLNIHHVYGIFNPPGISRLSPKLPQNTFASGLDTRCLYPAQPEYAYNGRNGTGVPTRIQGPYQQEPYQQEPYQQEAYQQEAYQQEAYQQEPRYIAPQSVPKPINGYNNDFRFLETSQGTNEELKWNGNPLGEAARTQDINQ
ncbi:hypothetical protein NEDG_01541 [Nematocida displodere]|uniref:Uncharacterized protein n=1 Tax=Nematocida displodere TaxID=1805483 RepID=A0A177EDG0_9MICR|nr:hypothetical protein NEDG_01541 [Nematocida displodere]